MYDLVVLGGGSGGLSVASAAAKVGARVALVERSQLGGECTFSACVPSKALIHAAKLAHQARMAGGYGVRTGAVEVDFRAVMERVRSVVASFAQSDSADTLRARGVDVYFGSPVFEAYDAVLVGGRTRVEGRRFVIATGSSPAAPQVAGLADAGYLDNQSVWQMNALPATLAVLGAGPAGLEFAQAFARLGSKVTVITHSAQILPREDPEISARAEQILAAEGLEFHKNVEVTKVELRDGKKVCKFRNKSDGLTFEAARDEILVATGRVANVEGLNLDAVGIHADPHHGIVVDDYLRTESPNIWAIGDVTGRYEFTHAAEREAAVAFQNAVLRLPKRMDYRTLPWTTFLDPEVATVGRLEGPAPDEEPEDLRVYRVEMADVDRARIDGQTQGFAKLVATPAGKIQGVSIIAPEASGVLQEFVLAMDHGLTLNDVMNTVHTYPTYSGMARKLAVQFSASRLDKGYVQTALRWFYGFAPRASEVPAQDAPVEPVAHADGNGHGHAH